MWNTIASAVLLLACCLAAQGMPPFPLMNVEAPCMPCHPLSQDRLKIRHPAASCWLLPRSYSVQELPQEPLRECCTSMCQPSSR